MSKKCTWISILLAILFTAGAAQADIIEVYGNGDFELGLTGWQYDDYYEDIPFYPYSYYYPKLMNVSDIGDGSGGDVGVKFRRLNGAPEDYNPVITRIEGPIEAGAYTYTVTFTGINMTGNNNWLRANLYWTNDPSDPWSTGNYGRLADIGTHDYYTDWVKLGASDNEKWQTQVANFVIDENDPIVGAYFSPWVQTENYDGGIIVGKVTLERHNPVPEPGTMLLLGTGLLGLWGFRKRFKK